MIEKHLTPTELAERWSVSISMLDKMRHEGRGPRFMKFGQARSARVRYRISDIETWEAANIYSSAGEAA